METTEKTMNPKVLEFIENAKKAQAEAQELEKQKQTAERDALLISLGLCRMEMVEIKKEEAVTQPDNFQIINEKLDILINGFMPKVEDIDFKRK